MAVNIFPKSIVTVTNTSTLFPAIDIRPIQFSGLLSNLCSANNVAAYTCPSHLEGS